MPWIMGLDEAGYGPNLGPFVMSLVAFRVPEPLAKCCVRFMKENAGVFERHGRLAYERSVDLNARARWLACNLQRLRTHARRSLHQYADCQQSNPADASKMGRELGGNACHSSAYAATAPALRQFVELRTHP